MKLALINILILVICVQAQSQGTTKTKRHATITRSSSSSQTTDRRSVDSISGHTNTEPLQQGETVTDRYLRGSATNKSGTTGQTTTSQSPFVGGIHAADGANRKMDTVARNSANVNSSQGGVTVRGANDTTFNVNTINQGGVNTNSGAVDRSGQAQFGQTNWGRGTRNTVGESQWTVPPPITSSFNKQFPQANSATWSRNNVDTTIYNARYRSGDNWITTSYNSRGDEVETRTEIPLVQAPRPVSVYLAKQPSTFSITTISRLQLQGRPEVYEVKTSTGKTVYINNDGMEVQY